MKGEKKLKCTDCGHDLKLQIPYDGCDWDSVNGVGSGFKYVIELCCDNCGRTFPIGRVKNPSDFSENIEQYRPYIFD